MLTGSCPLGFDGLLTLLDFPRNVHVVKTTHIASVVVEVMFGNSYDVSHIALGKLVGEMYDKFHWLDK